MPLAMGREVIFLQATLFIRDMKMTSPPVARYFGELALLTNKKRAATIRAASAHRAPNAPLSATDPSPTRLLRRVWSSASHAPLPNICRAMRAVLGLNARWHRPREVPEAGTTGVSAGREALQQGAVGAGG